MDDDNASDNAAQHHLLDFHGNQALAFTTSQRKIYIHFRKCTVLTEQGQAVATSRC